MGMSRRERIWRKGERLGLEGPVSLRSRSKFRSKRGIQLKKVVFMSLNLFPNLKSLRNKITPQLKITSLQRNQSKNRKLQTKKQLRKQTPMKTPYILLYQWPNQRQLVLKKMKIRQKMLRRILIKMKIRKKDQAMNMCKRLKKMKAMHQKIQTLLRMKK